VVAGGCVVVVTGWGVVVGGEVGWVMGGVAGVAAGVVGVVVVGVCVGVPAAAGVVVGVCVVTLGGEDGVETEAGAEDFPLESTTNQSFSTPCPPAWPFFVSLTKV
jgi:hypothetical protein